MITIKNKFQIVIPVKLRKEVGLSVGDFLEAGFNKGKITLTPKSLVDRQIEASLQDFRAGRTYGPFNTAEEMIISLKRGIKQIRGRKAKSPSR